MVSFCEQRARLAKKPILPRTDELRHGSEYPHSPNRGPVSHAAHRLVEDRHKRLHHRACRRTGRTTSEIRRAAHPPERNAHQEEAPANHARGGHSRVSRLRQALQAQLQLEIPHGDAQPGAQISPSVYGHERKHALHQEIPAKNGPRPALRQRKISPLSSPIRLVLLTSPTDPGPPESSQPQVFAVREPLRAPRHPAPPHGRRLSEALRARDPRVRLRNPDRSRSSSSSSQSFAPLVLFQFPAPPTLLQRGCAASEFSDGGAAPAVVVCDLHFAVPPLRSLGLWGCESGHGDDG